MAIKVSNQITFTEQKKIEKIEEWYLATNKDSDVTIDTDGWTTEVQVVDENNNYLWNYEKVIYSLGDPEVSEPVIIGFYGKGADGKSIVNIKNYYALTSDTNPPTSWQNVVPILDSVNRYLWNYEEITYTSGDPTITDPAIIGVYGDSGTDSVDFQIYSVDGFEFSKEIDSIELKTVAFQAGSSIESGATYQWKWWNSESASYENVIIETSDGATIEATSSSLTVSLAATYALSSLKCEMTYDGIVYEDYVTLTEKTTIYTSVIKFFDGSNIFDQTKSYVVAYVELYKDNQLEETIKAKQYYDGNNIIHDDGTIETDIEGVFETGNLIYFVYKNKNNEHKIVLGEFNGNIWSVLNDINKYSYVNDIYKDITSNVIIISKEDVSKSKDFNIEVYQNNIFISRCGATVIDINDPIISDVEPTNVKRGQLWLNTSVNPYELMIYLPGTKHEPINGELVESVTVFSMVGNQTNTREYTYFNYVVALDDGSVVMPDSVSTISVSYNTFSNLTNKIVGKYFVCSDVIYYVSEDATFTKSVKTITFNNSSTKIYTVTAENLNLVTTQLVPSDECEWTYFSQQNGGAVYTSQPSKYYKGDLWILADNETCGNFGPGTLLKATTSSNSFNPSHWTDTMEEITTTIANIKESFSWDDNGIKVMRRVTDSNGNVTNPFYVNIDSTRMGFHSVTYNTDGTEDDAEVVHIGINSAVIKNASFVDDNVDSDEYSKYENTNGALFDCDVNFNKKVSMYGATVDEDSVGFVWKIESNGSLSLATIT